MAIEDLDLEFEDDDSREKTDAVDFDIDLSFSSTPSDENEERKTQTQAPGGVRGKATLKKSSLKTATNLKRPIGQEETDAELELIPGGQSQNSLSKPKGHINNSKVQRDKQSTQNQHTQKKLMATDSRDSSETSVQMLERKNKILKNQLISLESSVEIRVAVAEAEKDYLVEYMSNAKVLDVQVTQILLKMNAKAPIIKSDAQLIKKLLTEFIHNANPKK